MELRGKPFAKGLNALVEDIKVRFDNKVFIVIISEFGRTPRINISNGRDHWPNAFGMTVICNDKNEIDGGRTIGHTNNSGEIIGGNALPSSYVVDTLLDLMKVRRFEKRGEVVTGVGFPYIDVLNGRVVT